VAILKSFQKSRGAFTDVKWRPIACGDVILKVASVIIHGKVIKALKTILRPVQRGVGVAGGCESAIHSVQVWLELNPTWIALKADFANAFNTMPRGLMLSKLFACHELKDAWRIIHMLYSQPSLLFLRAGKAVDTILSSEGARQGCVFGMDLFSLASLDLFTEAIAATGVQGVGLADDMTLVGEPDAIFAVFNWLQANALARAGLHLNIPKCAFFYPRPAQAPSPEVVALQEEYQGLKIIRQGCMPLLGSAVGLDHQARTAFVDNKITAMKIFIDKLQHRDITIQAFLHVMRTAVTSSLLPVFRTIPPAMCEVPAARLRDIMTDALAKKLVLPGRLLHHDTTAGQQVFLPLRHGGLGLMDPVKLLRPAFFASFATIASDLVSTKPVRVPAAGPAVPAAAYTSYSVNKGEKVFM
jgi:hypothetical protein